MRLFKRVLTIWTSEDEEDWKTYSLELHFTDGDDGALIIDIQSEDDVTIKMKEGCNWFGGDDCMSIGNLQGMCMLIAGESVRFMKLEDNYSEVIDEWTEEEENYGTELVIKEDKF